MLSILTLEPLQQMEELTVDLLKRVWNDRRGFSSPDLETASQNRNWPALAGVRCNAGASMPVSSIWRQKLLKMALYPTCVSASCHMALMPANFSAVIRKRLEITVEKLGCS